MEATDSTEPEPRTAWSFRWVAATLLSVAPVLLTAVFGPQSGMEAMIILIPWAGMLAAHVLCGPVGLVLAWREGRRGLVALFALYLTAFAGLHLAWWAASNEIPEKLETEYLRRYQPADYGLQHLQRQRDVDPARVAELVDAGAEVNRIGPKGWTPLFTAAGSSAPLVLALLEAGADPNIVSEEGSAPIHLAVRQEQLESVAALLAHGADPDLLDPDGQAPLCRVLGQGVQAGLAPDQLSMLGLLVEAGADPNGACRAFPLAVRRRLVNSLRMLLDAGHRNQHGDDPAIASALTLATRARDLEWAALLVEVGADPNGSMRLAIDRGDEALVALLLGAGADPNADLYLNRTAGNPERDALTDLLLRHGADPTLGDEEGHTALVEAARRAHDANVRRFAAMGADLDAIWRGEPLLLALHSMIPKRKHVTSLLVELGADVNVHGEKGRTPLMKATLNSHHAFMEALIEAQADLAAADVEGRTALHYAAETRFEAEQVLARLLDAGAAIEAPDAQGRTSLCVAQATGNRRIVAALEARGAQPQSCAPLPRSRRVLIRPSGKGS